MKKTSRLDDSDNKLLRDSGRWKLVCAGLPPEAKEVSDPGHLEWMVNNTESHAQREIFVPLKGSNLYGFDGKSFEVAPGTIFLFDAYDNHDKFYYQIKKNMKHIWFYLAGRKIVSRIHQANVKMMKYDVKQYIIKEEHLFPTLTKAWKKLKNPDLPLEIKRQGVISALSLVFMEIAELDILGNMLNKTSDHQVAVMTMIKGHIKETFGKGLTIERLARLAGYSEFHFMRLFKKHFGQSAHAYINEVRNIKVHEMLKEGCMKKEISYELGFSCPAAFANWYKANYFK